VLVGEGRVPFRKECKAVASLYLWHKEIVISRARTGWWPSFNKKDLGQYPTILVVYIYPQGFQVHEFSDSGCIRRKSQPGGQPCERHARDKKKHFDVSARCPLPESIVQKQARLRAKAIGEATSVLNCALGRPTSSIQRSPASSRPILA